jgi:hypothetical protein
MEATLEVVTEILGPETFASVKVKSVVAETFVVVIV